METIFGLVVIFVVAWLAGEIFGSATKDATED
jgi:hypothetical protein